MKRFYEEPVVEITVFDKENIMTASNVVNTAEGTASTHVESIEAAYGTTPGTEYASAQVYGSYGW